MPRIRTVKPEWLDDKQLNRLGSDCRVLSIGLILLADDHGRGRADIELLASKIWPYDPSPDRALSCVRALAGIRYISVYRHSTGDYYYIEGWHRHQKVDRPSRPLYPSPDECDRLAPHDLFASPRESSTRAPFPAPPALLASPRDSSDHPREYSRDETLARPRTRGLGEYEEPREPVPSILSRGSLSARDRSCEDQGSGIRDLKDLSPPLSSPPPSSERGEEFFQDPKEGRPKRAYPPEALSLWLEEQRYRALLPNPPAPRQRPSPFELDRISGRLTEGYTEDECRELLRLRAAEALWDAEKQKYFQSVVLWGNGFLNGIGRAIPSGAEAKLRRTEGGEIPPEIAREERHFLPPEVARVEVAEILGSSLFSPYGRPSDPSESALPPAPPTPEAEESAEEEISVEDLDDPIDLGSGDLQAAVAAFHAIKLEDLPRGPNGTGVGHQGPWPTAFHTAPGGAGTETRPLSPETEIVPPRPETATPEALPDDEVA